MKENKFFVSILIYFFYANSLQAVYITSKDTRIQEYNDFREEEDDYVKRRISIDFRTKNPGGYERIKAKDLADTLRDMISIRLNYNVLERIDFDNISNLNHVSRVAKVLAALYDESRLDSDVVIDISCRYQPPVSPFVQSKVENLKNTISKQRDKLLDFEIRQYEAEQEEKSSDSDND